MRLLFKPILALCFMLLAFPAISGMPQKEKLKCPIGGKKVEIVRTGSCTTWGASYTMSLRQPSSCDFVTRLPVCPREALPLYKKFSDTEVKQLKQFVKSDWYQASKTQSRFLRAYLIEKQFGSFSAENLFWLLQSGHFYDPSNTYGNEAYLKAFREAANAFLKEASEEDKKLIYLTAAFAKVHSKTPSDAHEMLKAARRFNAGENTVLNGYSKLVQNCISKPKSAECQPDHVVEVKE